MLKAQALSLNGFNTSHVDIVLKPRTEMLLMVKTSTCIGIMHEVFSLKYTFVSRQNNCHRVVG